MHVHTRDPFNSRLERLQELLFRKIIHTDVMLRLRRVSERANEHQSIRTYSNEEIRLGGVEKNQLHSPFNLLKRRLRMSSGQLMDPNPTLALTTGCRMHRQTER